MNKRKFLCLLLSLVMTLSVAVQGFAFTAFAENNATSLLLGDSNLDFKVNVKDATNIQKAIAKITDFGDIATATADVDKNDDINIKDATAIQKWLANIDVPYLIGELFEYLGEILSEGGFILLNVNPEIRIGFNADGNVTTVDANNDDAKPILEGFSDYQGKTCKEVVDRLLVLIKDAGYLTDDIDGENKLVVIQLEAGSKEPKNSFIDELKECARKELKKHDLKPEFIKIEGKDYDDKYASGDEASPFITLEKAVEIALAYSGVWAEDAVFEEKEYDIHHGTPYYDIEFTANGFEFEIAVNALNGKVVKFEKEKIEDRHHATGDEQRPDKPQKPHKPATFDEFITLDEAKKIALKDANLTAEDVRFTDREFDLEDGTPYFELEFVTEENEYEYKIHAVTGEIIESECEPVDEDKDDRHHHDKDEWFDKDEDDDSHNDDCQKPSNPLPTEPEESKPALETKPVPSKPAEEKPEETKPAFTTTVATKPQERPEFTKPEHGFIDVEDAKDEALNHAGANKDKVKFDKAELDEDDGKHRFEIEFEDEDFEYEYEIDAENGEIIDFEKDRKDRR